MLEAGALKTSKTIHFAFLIAATLSMLAGTSATPARAAALCDTMPKAGSQGVCAKGDVVTHVHEAPVGMASLSTRVFSVRCSTLFLGDVQSGATLGSQVTLSGAYTYADCTGGCVFTEESLPVEIVMRRRANGSTDLNPYRLEHVNCAGFANCTFKEYELHGQSRNSSLDEREHAVTTFAHQHMRKESGALCLDDGATFEIASSSLGKIYVTG